MTFLTGTDWECSSGPICTVNVLSNADLWPLHGLVLANGDHPVMAIGSTASRPHNIVGSVMSVEATNRAVVNIAPQHIVKAFVSNITAYNQGVASAWAGTLIFAQPVYVDDSADLAAGTTLSLSPTNSAGAQNPLAGFAWREQTHEPDTYASGGRTDNYPISFAHADEYAELTICVLIWPDQY